MKYAKKKMKNMTILYTDYSELLQKIGGVKFTPREIDTIACILCGRTPKKISLFLSITPRTVEAYIANIKQKLGCNSRESILDFVEKSIEAPLVRKHYQNLLLQFDFEKRLQEISKLVQESPACLLIYECEGRNKPPFIERIEKHLKLAGIKNVVMQAIDQNADMENTELFTFDQRAFQSQGPIIFLIRDSTPPSLPQTIQPVEYADFSKQKTYYFSVFDLLKRILPRTNIDNQISKFREQVENSHSNAVFFLREQEDNPIEDKKDTPLNPTHNLKKKKAAGIIVGLLCLSIFFMWAFLFNTNKQSSEIQAQIRSELFIPTEMTLLQRPSLLAQIKELFGSRNGIQTVALVGLGGSGKTTLARQYAQQQKARLVWEINAENKESFINSFKSLAYALAKTKDQKDALDFIQKIQNHEEVEKQIVLFVANALNELSDWFLIYDNVEEFSDIKNYFPQNSLQWGSGKVLVTTRNSNIKNTGYIKPENAIQVEELNHIEAITLFSKILYNDKYSNLPNTQKEEILELLKYIPQLPLDVSTAAHYIKNSQVTLDEYLKRILHNNKSFEDTQKVILKGVGGYIKTRSDIIALSFKKIMEVHPEFKELLLLICLLDSQDIPKNFLNFYKDPSLVDQFLYTLKRYSLITSELSPKNAEMISSVSLHRSTQMLGKTFLLSILDENEKKNLVDKTIMSIKSYYHLKQDRQFLVSLVPHLEVFLRNINDIPLPEGVKIKHKLDLFYVLGGSYYTVTKNFIAAKNYFSLILECPASHQHFSDLTLALLLKDLGNISIKLCDFDQKYSERSIELCKKIPNSEIIIAENLQAIGATYRKRDNFEKANDYLTSALDKVLLIDQEKRKELESEIYNQLGWLYSVTFINTGKAYHAQKYLLRSLDVLNASPLFHLRQTTPQQKLSCLVAKNRCRLGLINIRLGHYKEALNEGFLEAEFIKHHELDNCPKDLSTNAQIAEGIAEILLREGDVAQAEQKLSEAIKVFDVIVGVTPALVPKSLRVEARIRQGKLEEAYKECIELLRLKNRERNPFHNLIHLTNFYFAALIKYKQEDHQKSVEHFRDFFKNIKLFCKSFLEEKTYTELERQGLFSEIKQSKDPIQEVKLCLLHSSQIFSAIYGFEHPFVKYCESISSSYMPNPEVRSS